MDESFIIETAKRLIPLKSVGPLSDGPGESRKAEEICKIIKELGYNYERYDIDGRPNIIVRIGSMEKTLWIISHMDTVPEGDINLWHYDPYQATVSGDLIYGRGTEDNGQGIFTSLLLLKNLKPDRLKFNLGLAFVSDEETGSNFGIKYLIKNNIFKKDDLIIVPDAGTPDGRTIEIAEKSILWLKINSHGRQYHASMPGEAINATKELYKFVLNLESRLKEKYNKINDVFDPPYSTFEITKHGKNVDNINTIPGFDSQFLDCRILPDYDVNDVLRFIDDEIAGFKSPARISYEIIQREDAPEPTKKDSEIVNLLSDAIENPKVVGIGGGTCAAFFRENGIPAVVWSTTDVDVAHQADEFVRISNIIKDAKTIERIIYK
ncbi:M20 family metallo-hydrolase [Picrophilus oshimae]|uniref:Succinyl-diaminopimelate desuccinylase n=1 Tax=Picrophilus torridus (strain ATCC 700027 / DSM 9790 / JCM 10055 / NBRC 100828 / KAW 2/3) TaxID=1122961 RepID=Q6L017_PICTO|nr:M20 family metallo-hydrolase [Picrophilus oshimae]AAT43685.1 succinyl-diaminopimelate desuccinylase [Picrophilus oshimae DSM 9789]